MNMDWMQESIQITYGTGHEIYTGNYPPEADPRYRVVQYQGGPTVQHKDSFLKYDRREPGSIVATCSFKAGNYFDNLQNILGRENVVWTYGPTVPEVHYEHSAFDQPNMLWSYRNFCDSTILNPKGMNQLFGIIADNLRNDPNAKLVILAQPQNPEQSKAIEEDIRAFFFSFGFSKQLHPYQDRVEILTAIDWLQMLELMSKTKLIISPAMPLDGPPFEAASYGIPTILDVNMNPFINKNKALFFPEVLSAPAGFSPQFFNHLQRLNTDRAFYESHGNAYRKFVDENATYSAYVKSLEDIAKQRGWDG